MPFQLGDSSVTMVSAFNVCLREALDRIPNTILFGEDIEDQRVEYGFTKAVDSLSIARVAILTSRSNDYWVSGRSPLPGTTRVWKSNDRYLSRASNQYLTTHSDATGGVSNGEGKCPMVIYAPYGASFQRVVRGIVIERRLGTHIPGLRVAVPSTTDRLVWTCGTAT